MTNWEKYFGTPERAGGALDFIVDCGICLYQETENIKDCNECRYGQGHECTMDYAEWLESEADHE